MIPRPPEQETSSLPVKHTMPPFLAGKTTAEAYEHWLGRKASAHVKRDRGRNHHPDVAKRSQYKEAIHAAVVLSGGLDAYTGEQLDWRLISTYDNDESKLGRYGYKARFALLPTVDHIDAGASEASFRICAWRTNDAKNDLSPAEFVELCRRVVAFADAPKP
jgi:hypothetical protein